MLPHRLDQRLGRHLDAEVHHLEAVVRQDDVHQVLADVVHVALDRREEHFSARGAAHLVHVRLEERDRRFHRLGALQHLGDDELVGIEEAADLVHAAHERPVDDVQRLRPLPQLLGEVAEQSVTRSFDDVAREALVERQLAACGTRRLLLAEVRGECGDRFVQLLLLTAEEHRFGELSLVLRDGRIPFELLGVHQRQVETSLHAMVEEDGIDHLASRCRQAEGHVGDAEDRLAGRQRRLDCSHRFDRLHCAAGVRRVARGAREDQRVEIEVLFRDAILRGEQLVAAARHRELVRGLDRLSALVDATHHERCAKPAGERDDLLEPLLPVFQVDRVDHQRHSDLLDQHLEQAAQIGNLVAIRLLRGNVDHVRASLYLRARDFRCLVPLLLGNQVAELLRPEDVGALADDYGPHVVGDFQCVDAGKRAPSPRRDLARLEARRDLRKPGNVAAMRSAAASHQVQPAVLAETPKRPRQHLGRLEVLAALVGKAGIRHARHARARELRQGADVVRHELRTRRAVEPEVEEIDVLERDRERVDRLTRQHGPHRLDGAAHRDGQALLGREPALETIDPDQARFHVARVLRRFEEPSCRPRACVS